MSHFIVRCPICNTTYTAYYYDGFGQRCPGCHRLKDTRSW